MAIRLTDVVTVMKSKWTYGDKFFGYTEEFNDNHSTQYPSILITPPSSVFPEVSLNNGWELYTFEIYFSDLYNRTAQANVNLDQRWDNLQDLANEWLDMFLKNYQDGVVTGFLEGEDVSVERVKEVANDQLIQIRMNFTWKVFSKCFRPQSVYPTDIANLVTWLRADSGLTFDIPTKKINAWGDYSGSNNGLVQATKSKQPLRYTYDGANDKSRVEFNGTTDYFDSVYNLPITTQFTIFQVSKNSGNTLANILEYTSGGKVIKLSYAANSELVAQVNDGTTAIDVTLAGSNASNYHIGTYKLHNKRLYVDYDALGSSLSTSVQEAGYDNTTVYNDAAYTLSSATLFINANLQEFIIFNSALDDYTIGQIKSYLNKKYNIY
tara:strand:+ start:3644 stop:4783 length:1140 start_codon:yes stop_codon:yes gene_type:complete